MRTSSASPGSELIDGLSTRAGLGPGSLNTRAESVADLGNSDPDVVDTAPPEPEPVDYSSMWPYLNSDFGVEQQPVDYSSMWPYLNSDFLGPIASTEDPVWTVIDGGSLGAITAGEPATVIRRERATSSQADAPMLGMIDPSPLPKDRFPS